MTSDQGNSHTCAPIVICSDLHIKTLSQPRAQTFLAFLKNLDPNQVQYIILNGDIFDFYFGAKDFFYKKFEPIISCLEKLAAEGVKVFFIEGNHEFSMNRTKWKGVSIISKGSLVIEWSPKIYLAFCHGDTLMAPWHYFIYRWITRTRVFAWLASFIPCNFLDHLALKISSASRKRSYLKKVFHKRVLEKAIVWLTDLKLPHDARIFGIFGHFHLPYHYPPKGKHQKTLLCVKSWDEPNLLLFNGQDFQRFYF